MKPSHFKESNSTLLGGPPEKYGVDVGDLPTFKDGTNILSCWRLTLRERLSVLLWGRVWLCIRGGAMHPPVAMWAKRAGFEEAPDD